MIRSTIEAGLFALGQVIGPDMAAALMARLLGPRLLAVSSAVGGALAAMVFLVLTGTGRFALMLLIPILLELVASLLAHEHYLPSVQPAHRDAGDA